MLSDSSKPSLDTDSDFAITSTRDSFLKQDTVQYDEYSALLTLFKTVVYWLVIEVEPSWVKNSAPKIMKKRWAGSKVLKSIKTLNWQSFMRTKYSCRSRKYQAITHAQHQQQQLYTMRSTSCIIYVAVTTIKPTLWSWVTIIFLRPLIQATQRTWLARKYDCCPQCIDSRILLYRYCTTRRSCHLHTG